MTPRQLARKLVAEPTARGRRKLLSANRGLIDVRLADELSEICIELWSSEPTVARRAALALTAASSHRPEPDILAYRSWVNGISAITQGKLGEAADLLADAESRFTALGSDHLAARTMVAQLLAVAMLGRYDAASEIGDRALSIFDAHDDQLAAGKIELNLSNVAARRGRPSEALRFGLRAVDRFESIGNPEWQVMAENSLANTYAELHDLTRAETLYSKALAGARDQQMLVTEAEIEASLGNLSMLKGSYGDALSYFEASRRKYDDLGMPHQSAIADLEIADIYSELSLYDEAYDIYAATVPKLRSRRLRAEEARARANFGRAAERLGRLRKARGQWDRAARLYDQEGDRAGAALVQLSIARLVGSQGDPGGAHELAENARAVLEQSDNPRHLLQARWVEAELAADAGKLPEAARRFRALVRSSEKLEQHAIRQAALNSLGKIAAAQGKSAAAIGYFENAASIVEELRAPLPGEEFRMAFLSRRLEPFHNLARLHVDAGRPVDALQWIERGRSRSLAESVGGARAAAAAESSDPLAAKLEAARSRLNSLYSRLDSGEADGLHALSSQIKKLEKQAAELSRRLSGTAGHSFERTGGKYLDVESLRRRLGTKAALIEYVEFEGRLSALVVTSAEVSFVGDFASVADVEREIEALRFQLGSFRYGARLAVMASVITHRVDSHLGRLFGKLLAPLMKLVGDRRLIVVPSGPLNYVPFHGLKVDGRYLIETREVLVSPSAAIWLDLHRRRKKRSSAALLMGFANEQIPMVGAEIDRLARLMPSAGKYTGESCTFAEYIRLAPAANIIHIACHGDFRPEAPMYSSLHLAEGWVTAADVARQRLRAELVTLSACDTGMHKIAAGDEVLGLARGFLSAGARNVVLSSWAVSDAEAPRLMEDLYTEIQRGSAVAASLRKAQINAIARGVSPYVWAPYFLIGAG